MNPCFRKQLVYLSLVLWWPTHVRAAGTIAAEFLRFSVGTVAGMSEAAGAIQQDVTALSWNPAGLATLNRPDVYVSHNSLPMTLRHDYLAVGLPIPILPAHTFLAYSAQALTQRDLEKWTNTGAAAGSYQASDMAHTVGVATAWDEWRVGVSVRYIRQTLDDASGTATAVGGGLQRNFGHWDTGLSIANLGSDLRLGSESAPLPRTARAGVGLRLLNDDLLLATDLSHTATIGVRNHLGAQYRLYPPRPAADKGSITVRAGYTFGNNRDDAYSGAAWGLSLAISSMRADFSYQPFGDLGNSLQLGVGYRF